MSVMSASKKYLFYTEDQRRRSGIHCNVILDGCSEFIGAITLKGAVALGSQPLQKPA